MADLGTKRVNEIDLLKKELEVQGEILNVERRERRAEIDQLKLEVETLKKLIDRTNPGFLRDYENFYSEERQRYNPDLGININSVL